MGSEVIEQLNEYGGYNITVVDCMSKQVHGKNWEQSYLYKKIEGKCDFIKADVKDFDVIRDVVTSADCIIHLAAETGTGQSMYQINQYNEDI